MFNKLKKVNYTVDITACFVITGTEEIDEKLVKLIEILEKLEVKAYKFV